jgi:2,3-diketo-5-methylthio-1-phosphopentane phosphatase
MLDSVHHPFPECTQLLLDNITLDPGFKTFYEWSLANNVPVIVLSSGMEPIIRALLTHLIGPSADKIVIVSNDKTDLGDGKWTIKFHDESHFGHDKSLAIKPYFELPADKRPVMFYAGDGVSDLSAARETDLLFAKKGRDLVTYCEKEKVPFTVFEDWSTILEITKDIYEGKTDVKTVAAAGLVEAHDGK